MRSRINRIYPTPEGNICKEAGEPFFRGSYRFDPRESLRREIGFLRKLDGRHFPRVIEEGYGFFVMSDSGVPLTVTNLPSDWALQVDEIAASLKAAKIIHRDIKEGNLLVKNNNLYLIDFGWSVYEDEHAYICPRELVREIPREFIYDNHAALIRLVTETVGNKRASGLRNRLGKIFKSRKVG